MQITQIQQIFRRTRIISHRNHRNHRKIKNTDSTNDTDDINVNKNGNKQSRRTCDDPSVPQMKSDEEERLSPSPCGEGFGEERIFFCFVVILKRQ